MNFLKSDSDDEKEKEKEARRAQNAAAGLAAWESVNQSVEQLGVTYEKPDSYTGNRKLYDSPSAKVNAKREAFANGKKPHDDYTGDKLCLTKKEAKATYGAHWTSNLAEADHTVPIKEVFERYKDDAWVTNEDIRDIVNSKENIKVISRRLNNAKRDRTNEKLANDKEYLKKKDIKLLKKAPEQMIRNGKDTDRFIERQILKAKVCNIAGAFHQAGTNAASQAAAFTGFMSASNNLMAVITGKKSSGDAIKDVIADTAKSAGIVYVNSGGLAVVGHTLANEKSPFLQSLAKNNVPGKVLTAIMSTGGTLLRYGKGEINTVQCIEELGKTGITTVVTGYSMAVGQAVIPVPVVGAAIGAMLGSAICGDWPDKILGTIQRTKLAREERIRIEHECEEAIRQIRTFRRQFRELTESYFTEHERVFEEAFGDMDSALKLGDIDGYIHGINKITRQLGGKPSFENMKEFDSLMKSDEKIVF